MNYYNTQDYQIQLRCVLSQLLVDHPELYTLEDYVEACGKADITIV